MRLSNTFNKTMNAYKDKYRFIINSGGSRSSKTYSTLQLLYIIAKNSTKKRIIHVVSYSTPHLRDGAITDFEDIIQNEGEDLEEVRLKNPYTFTIGNSIIKFAIDSIPGLSCLRSGWKSAVNRYPGVPLPVAVGSPP